MTEKKPDDRLIDRAVVLWKRLLGSPKYDNIGDSNVSGAERLTSSTASAMASMIPSNATPERLEKFGEALRERLSKPIIEWDKECTYTNPYYETFMGVDYGPDTILRSAADTAGLKMEFPWKTRIYLEDNCVSVSAGYAAPYVHHYPLADGRWLVTTLSGRDIDKVIEYVEGGRPEFTIE